MPSLYDQYKNKPISEILLCEYSLDEISQMDNDEQMEIANEILDDMRVAAEEDRWEQRYRPDEP